MIYYFTGTGNSLYVAQKLAELTNDSISSIAEIMAGKAMPAPGEVIGIVYPVYAWSPPKMVRNFVKKLSPSSGYTFSVCTCGENCGLSMKMLEKSLGRGLDAAYSIAMPNNYMMGFDVDSPEEVNKKLAETEVKIAAIADDINARKTGVYDVVEGSNPFISKIVPPLFNAFATSAKPFYAEDSCNGCGKCALVCPTRNITVEKKPRWGKDCTACFACINHCPVKAIQRGKDTKNKGRYVNPNCHVEYDWT